MAIEQLDTSDDFEISTNSGNKILMPLMDEYPNAQNTFDIFANTEGEGLSDEQQNQIADTIGAVAQVGAQLYANRDETKGELKQICGRRPLFKKNRGDYDICKADFYKARQGGGTRIQENFNYTPPPLPPPKGLSTGAVIGIVLGVVGLGLGGYFLYKRNK
tara:strand:+ start:144 stop:626 length:483 start_codon:yes stop_codon:yes gene_type:complete